MCIGASCASSWAALTRAARLQQCGPSGLQMQLHSDAEAARASARNHCPGMWKKMVRIMQHLSTVQDQALSVREQVQTLIEAATDVGNLAQMYEGWSAWI